MAKSTAPLLSFSAEGQIAETMVYATWRGIPYVRRYVKPSNPKTLEQQKTRTTFALMREMWKLAPNVLREPWDAFATGRPFLGLNKFIGENIRTMRGDPDMANFIGSPGARGGLPPTNVGVAATAIAGELQFDFTNPAAPTGWAITEAVAVAFIDQDPAGFFTGQITGGTDALTPFDTVLLTDLQSGVLHRTAAWLKWSKPDGQAAYSVGITGSGTPL